MRMHATSIKQEHRGFQSEHCCTCVCCKALVDWAIVVFVCVDNNNTRLKQGRSLGLTSSWERPRSNDRRRRLRCYGTVISLICTIAPKMRRGRGA